MSKAISLSVVADFRQHNTSFLNTPILCLTPVIFLAIVAFFEPEVLVQAHPSMHKLIRLGSYVSLIFGALSVLESKMATKTGIFLLFLTFSSLLAGQVSGFSQQSSQIDICLSFARVFLQCSLFRYWLNSCPRKFLYIGSVYFFVLCILNLIVEIACPSGLYQAPWTHEACFLFGHKNTSILGFLPGSFFIGLYDYFRSGRLRCPSFVYLALIFANVLLSRSSTSSAAVIMGFIFALCFALHRTNFLSPLGLFTGSFLISFFLIFVKIQSRFAGLIFSLFHKTVTFSGRTSIWERAYGIFEISPIVGCGTIASETMRSLIGGVNPHNFFLGILVSGGLLRLTVYVLFFVIMASWFSRIKMNPEALLFVFVFTVLAVVGLMENLDETWCLICSCLFLEAISDKRSSNMTIQPYD